MELQRSQEGELPPVDAPRCVWGLLLVLRGARMACPGATWQGPSGISCKRSWMLSHCWHWLLTGTQDRGQQWYRGSGRSSGYTSVPCTAGIQGLYRGSQTAR